MKKKDFIKEKYLSGELFNSASCHGFNSASCHGFNSASCHGFNSATYKEKNLKSHAHKGKLSFDVLEWEITHSCSLAREIGPCKFCYAESGYKSLNELSQEERIKIVKLFVSPHIPQMLI
ncbi:MAG: hypothetical protein QMD80_05645 [archaeon]|nr:hypothetical protein [archaeon]